MTNSRTDELMKSYTPVLSVVVYKSNDYYANYYLEGHTITDDGKIMEGRPLMQETMQGIVDVFFDENQNKQKFSGLFPDNMLSFKALPRGKYKMVWYRPAEKRVMYFKQELKMPSEQTWIPAMLYVTDGLGLDVFALSGNSRPNEATKLYRPPFWNVNDSGDVCLGNARVNRPQVKTYENLMKYWEDLFWLSEFTHTNGDKLIKSDAKKVWKQLLTSKCTLKFPSKELIPLKITLKKFI